MSSKEQWSSMLILLSHTDTASDSEPKSISSPSYDAWLLKPSPVRTFSKTAELAETVSSAGLPQAESCPGSAHPPEPSSQAGCIPQCHSRHYLRAIEPLATAHRDNTDIMGIHRGGIMHKVSLYADDLLLYVSDTRNSLNVVLSLLGILCPYQATKSTNLQQSDY